MEQDASPAFASVVRDGVRLLLSDDGSSGRCPLPDGRRQAPGGWNRVPLEVTDLAAEVARLRAAGVSFRTNDIVTGPGGGPGQDNFAPLTSLKWQVHMYGEARRGVAEACAELHLLLHLFAWQPGMRRAGFRRAALYLIRPDGYVALADPQADPKRLRHYFAERGGLGQHGGQAHRVE